MTVVTIPLAQVALELRLPGEWSIVPLEDAAGAHRAVRALTRAAARSADEGVVLRSPIVRAALAEIDRGIAASAGEASAGRRLLVARSIVEGVALPLSILVAPLAQPVTPALTPTAHAVLDVMELALAGRNDGFSAVVRPDLGRASALRRIRTAPAAEALDAGRDGAALDAIAGTPRLEVEHWLVVPGTRRVVRLLASTPVAGMTEVVVGFLDAIVRAARWEHPLIGTTGSATRPRED